MTVDEDARWFSLNNRVENAIDAAPSVRAAKQALDSKHVVRGRVRTEPFAQEL
jgi:hypothetical protein